MMLSCGAALLHVKLRWSGEVARIVRNVNVGFDFLYCFHNFSVLRETFFTAAIYDLFFKYQN